MVPVITTLSLISRILSIVPLIKSSNELDFGINEQYQGLEPNSEKQSEAIKEMFEVLIKPEIFEGFYRISIRNVVVNGKNYGNYNLHERFYVGK